MPLLLISTLVQYLGLEINFLGILGHSWRLQMHAAAAILAETATLIAFNEDDLYESDPFADENLEDNETVIDEN